MRRPLLIGVLLVAGLVAVFIAQRQLRTVADDGRIELQTTESLPHSDEPYTIDLGVEQPSGNGSRPVEPNPHPSTVVSQQDVMGSLVQARELIRKKAETSEQAGRNTHRTPGSIVAAAEKLGELATLEENNPAYKPEFQSFYLECLNDEKVITVTRAQCVESYVKSKGLEGEDLKQFVAGLPGVVKRLYSEIQP